MYKLLLSAAAIGALSTTADAQALFGLEPFQSTGDLYVTDPGTDSVYRLFDLNLDGDFNDPGEVTTIYDEDFGNQTLGNNNGITVASNGDVFICDTSEDAIFRLIDLNGDGDCYDAGEFTTYFDGDPLVNLSGVQMVSPNKVVADQLGVLWIAEANNGSGGTDSILRLEDLNVDGDANDAGEATVYYAPITSGSTGDSIPNDLVISKLDNRMYYLEGASTGFIGKEVFRLNDANFDGVIDPVTEVASFFAPPAQANTPFFWSLTQDELGYFYIADSGNELIWRFRDENADDVVDPVTEAVIYWQGTSSLIWDMAPATGGGLFVAESQAPDRVLFLFDTDGNGTIDPVTEVSEVYDDTISGVVISNPRGMALDRKPTINFQPTIALGGTLNVLHLATQGDLILNFYSTATSAPTPLIPYGFLELAAAPASGLLYTAVADQFGFNTRGIAVPNNPALVGVSLHAQSIVGKPDRFAFTNLSTTTVF